MRTLLHRLRNDRLGSVPAQYALVAAGTALVAVMVAQTAAGQVAGKLGAVAAALTRIQF